MPYFTESSPDQSPEPKSERRMSNLSVRGQKSNGTSHILKQNYFNV